MVRITIIKWQGMPQTTPTVSGGMNALLLPAETIGTDTHAVDLALPVSTYEADAGYCVDDTEISRAKT
jgi:hypothetical protein